MIAGPAAESSHLKCQIRIKKSTLGGKGGGRLGTKYLDTQEYKGHLQAITENKRAEVENPWRKNLAQFLDCLFSDCLLSLDPSLSWQISREIRYHLCLPGDLWEIHSRYSCWRPEYQWLTEQSGFIFNSRCQDNYITECSLLRTKPTDAQKAKLNSQLTCRSLSIMGSLNNITNTRIIILMMPSKTLIFIF